MRLYQCANGRISSKGVHMLFQQAVDHVNRAREFLASNSESGVRHAALELRMAIERIAYRFLPLYAEELTDDILKGWNWQPKRILEALIECNPGAERALKIAGGFSNPDGTRGTPVLRGSQSAIPKKLFSRNYDKLGSLVHLDPRGEQLDLCKTIAFIEATALRLETYCKDTTIIVNALGPALSITCECGRVFRRSMAAAHVNPQVRCPAASCAAIYDLVETNNGATVFRHHETFTCPSCSTQNTIASGAIPLKFGCSECAKRFVIDEGIFVRYDSTSE